MLALIKVILCCCVAFLFAINTFILQCIHFDGGEQVKILEVVDGAPSAFSNALLQNALPLLNFLGVTNQTEPFSVDIRISGILILWTLFVGGAFALLYFIGAGVFSRFRHSFTPNFQKEWERTVDAMPDMISILDKDLTIIRSNKAVSKMLGLSFQEILGSRCYETLCGKNGKPDECPCTTLFKNKKSIRNEIYDDRLDCHFEVILSPILGRNEELIGVVHVSRDITERKQLEKEVEENHLYLASILDSAGNTAIVATDAKMQVKYCNRETERLLGLSHKNVLGQSVEQLHEVFGSKTKRKVSEAMKQVRENGGHQFIMKRDGLILDAQVAAIRGKNKEFGGVLLTARDITEQRKTEQRLRQAEKLEGIGLMASGVAHDLNNILSGIVGYPDLLLQQLEPGSKLRDPLLQIQQSGRRAADVVDDLLTLARGVAKHKENLSLNEIIREYLNSQEFRNLRTRYQGIEVDEAFDSHIPHCNCAPGPIRKVIMNLIHNSFEAIGEHGTVTLSTRTQNKLPSMLDDSVQISNFVALEIRDTGPGIDNDVMHHIFEPFYSTKRIGRSGTGLGLAIAWQVIKDHGGLITVDSNETGSVFTIFLPAVTKPAIVTEYSSKNDPVTRKGTGTVLVVDDDEMQCDIAGQMLVELGYHVHTVPSGEAAIDWLSKNNADLLLLDMALGSGINGRQTLERILPHTPEQRAVICSGLADEEDVQKSLDLGACGYLRKPYSLHQLGQVMFQALSQEAEMEELY